MRFTASAFLGLALLLFGDMSWAQDSTPPRQTDEEVAWSNFLLEEVLLRSCEDPTLRSALALPQPKLILEATDDGKTKVKARVGLEVKRKFILNLEVESPRNSSGETTLASLDGLSKGSTAELAFSWIRWKPERYSLWWFRKIKEEADRATANKKNASPQNRDAAEDAFKKMIDTLSPEADATGWRMADFLNSPMARPTAVAMLGPEEYKRAAGAYRNWLRHYDKLIPVFTINANAEQKEFQFFTLSADPPAGRRKNSEFHTNYQFTASAGAYLWGRIYSALNYSSGRKFEGGATEEFCTATGAARILDCTTFIVAPPKKGKPEALEFEVRGLVGSFGLAAHLTRDLEANVTAVELPIYFLQKLGSSQMELNGGLVARWRSDTDDYSLSVFIGPALSTVLRMLNR